MGFVAKMPKIRSLCVILLLTIATGTCVSTPSFKASLENFSHNIFNELVHSHDGENIIFSPFSIQTCLAMVRMGAGAHTAAELDRELSFTGQTPQSVADNYFQLLSKYENSNNVQTANKIYVMKDYELQDQYKEVLSEKFFSSAENINFAENENAAQTINSWVQTKTHNIIKDLLDPKLLGEATRFCLVSAIYFKGEWEQGFDIKLTKPRNFHVDGTKPVDVMTMFKKEVMQYGSFPELNAQVMRMNYKDSDLSMWIFLPNALNGLSDLEEKLTNVRLEALAKRMEEWIVMLEFPKFKVEFTMDLSETLAKMGMTSMFENADFSNMLKSSEPLEISNVVHKAFIEVNEAGTEASAATAMLGVLRTASPPLTHVNVDHPFYYVIANKDIVPLFQGTVVKM